MSNLAKVAAQRSLLEQHGLSFFADAPVVHHCHHFNLFLDQTVDDALGSEASSALRVEAAREASHDLLSGLARALGADTPAERLELARNTLSSMGHGRLEVLAGRKGGRARGEFLHYGFSWQQKYGAVVKRSRPADMFAAGFAAAALEVAFDLPRETIAGEETACTVMRSPTCEFDLSPGEPAAPRIRVDRAACEAVAKPSFGGQQEERISNVAATLRDFAAGISGDERGLIQAFGVFLTLHPAGYYNRISYDTVERVSELAPKSAGILEALLQESGHVCVFNTFGGIIRSPEWEAMVGSVGGGVEEIISSCCAIGRALGFGHWTIGELEPGRRFVLRTPSTYESSYFVTRNGVSDSGRCYFLPGAALAMMQLAHQVDWREPPNLTQEFYNDLFRRGVPWKVEETRCICRGDEMCEAVVLAT